jgi:lysozyme
MIPETPCPERRWLGFIKPRTYLTVPEIVMLCAMLALAWFLRQAVLSGQRAHAAHIEVMEQLTHERQEREVTDAEIEAAFSRLHILPAHEAGVIAQPLSDPVTGRLGWTNERVDNIISQLVRDEGIVLKPYRVGNDAKNPLLIGAGHNLNANGISEATARFILREDLENVRAQLQPYNFYRKSDPVRRGVLENITYAEGLGGLLTHKSMLEAAGAGDWNLAADELAGSAWCVVVGPRCERLKSQMRQGVWK